MEKVNQFDIEKLGNNFMQMIIDSSPSGYLVVDKEFNIVFVNEFVKNFRGFTIEELLNKRCYEVVNGGEICNLCPVKIAMESNSAQNILKEEEHILGHTVYTECYAVPLIKEDGTYDYIIEILSDKTAEITMQNKIERDFFKIVKTLCSAIEKKDKSTGLHSENVKRYAMLLGKKLKLSKEELKKLLVVSSLHDVGKIGISDIIINKKGALTEEERKIMENHPIYSEEILENLEQFKDIKSIVRHHHEKIDGTGYPDKLKGDEIPFLSKLIAIVDTFDVITSRRAYKDSFDIKIAKNELILNSGTQFDTKLVKTFVKMIDDGEITI